MDNRVYVENRDNFWRDLLVRIALIVLFIFLLIWLFPMPKLDTFYDRIFADNIKMMQEAAKDYYTIERLPIEIGDKKKITLREMLDKKMILPFLDKDGNSCDFDKSYVEVTRMGVEEYTFKVNLSCNTKTDYIISYFGCYDVCVDDECEEKEQKIIEYQHSRKISKEVIDRYTCPSDYVLRGSSCVKESSIIDKIAVNISCITGYNYNGVTDSCEKVVTTEIPATRDCPTGYSYDVNSKMCLKYITRDETPTPICLVGSYNSTTGKCVIGNTTTYNATLVCDIGTYNPTTGKCVSSADASYNATLVCDKGTYNSTTGKCVATVDASYNASLVCKQGTPSGSVCIIAAATTTLALKNTTSSTSTVTIAATKTWDCQTFEYSSPKAPILDGPGVTFKRTYLGMVDRYTSCGVSTCLTTFYKYNECTAIYICSDKSYTYNRVTGLCAKQITTYNTTYYCASGATPIGDRCPVPAVTIPKVYDCPNGGTLSGSRCIATAPSITDPRYTCPNGGTVSGTRCIATTPSITDPRNTCPNGGKLTGSVCYVSGTTTANPTLACNVGTLIGNVCKITTIDKKNATYSCNGVPSGETCVTSTTLREQVNYSCNYGYDRAGSYCIKTISSSSTINATAIYKSVSSIEYKWSREISINGWTRTGQTREVVVAYNQNNYVYEK